MWEEIKQIVFNNVIKKKIKRKKRNIQELIEYQLHRGISIGRKER